MSTQSATVVDGVVVDPVLDEYVAAVERGIAWCEKNAQESLEMILDHFAAPMEGRTRFKEWFAAKQVLKPGSASTNLMDALLVATVIAEYRFSEKALSFAVKDLESGKITAKTDTELYRNTARVRELLRTKEIAISDAMRTINSHKVAALRIKKYLSLDLKEINEWIKAKQIGKLSDFVTIELLEVNRATYRLNFDRADPMVVRLLQVTRALEAELIKLRAANAPAQPVGPVRTHEEIMDSLPLFAVQDGLLIGLRDGPGIE